MKILLLNLPNPTRIVRRYMCSYNSPTFLFPPLELISVAALLRTIEGVTVALHDAIAEQTNTDGVCELVERGKFDAIISLCGFECFDNDMKVLQYLRNRLPQIKQVLFGYYPTQFPEQILQNTDIDVLLLGEPEYTCREVFKQWQNSTSAYEGINGIAYRRDNEIIVQNNTRITHLNELLMPAYDLLKIELYSEPFLPQPFGMIQSARGCPYKCNYCVRSYGIKLSTLYPERMIAEVKEYIRLFNIKSFRFIDDTFTATPARVIRFCQLLEEENIRLEWSCLSRADTMNEEMLGWMYKTGCRNIYVGAESGSQQMLDFYNKGVDLNLALQNITLCKKMGFRMMGLFMVSPLTETEEDLEKSLAFAKQAGFDYVSVFQLQIYPGTELYNTLKDRIEFSLFPYVNKFKDEALNKKKHELQRKFYKAWYYRPNYLVQKIPDAFHYSKQALRASVLMSKFLISPAKESDRSDFI